MKKCINCGQSKTLDDFPVRKDSPDGRRNQCRECTRARVSDWAKNRENITREKERINNPPLGFKYCRGEFGCGELKPVEEFSPSKRTKDGLKSYCKDCYRENKRKDQEKNRELYSERAKVRREANKEEIREKDRLYREENKDTLLVKKREYYNKNRESILLKKKDYYKNNKYIAYNNKTKRRERQAGCGDEFNAELRDIVFRCFGGKCLCCGGTEKLSIDHYRPLSKGNALTLLNAVLLCKGCNSSKHDKDPEDFYGPELCLLIDIMLLVIDSLYKKST